MYFGCESNNADYLFFSLVQGSSTTGFANKISGSAGWARGLTFDSTQASIFVGGQFYSGATTYATISNFLISGTANWHYGYSSASYFMMEIIFYTSGTNNYAFSSY